MSQSTVQGLLFILRCNLEILELIALFLILKPILCVGKQDKLKLKT